MVVVNGASRWPPKRARSTESEPSAAGACLRRMIAEVDLQGQIQIHCADLPIVRFRGDLAVLHREVAAGGELLEGAVELHLQVDLAANRDLSSSGYCRRKVSRRKNSKKPAGRKVVAARLQVQLRCPGYLLDAAGEICLADGGERQIAAAALQAIVVRKYSASSQQCRFLALEIAEEPSPQQFAGGDIEVGDHRRGVAFGMDG